MRSYYFVGLFLFNATLIPVANCFGLNTWWAALLQAAALVLSAFMMAYDAYATGIEETEKRWAEAVEKTEYASFSAGYSAGYSAGQRAANDHIRQMMEDVL